MSVTRAGIHPAMTEDLNDPTHTEPLTELPSPLEDKDMEEDAIPAQLLSTLMEVEAIPLMVDPLDPPEATEVLVEVPEEVPEDPAEVLEEDPEEVKEVPPTEEGPMEDTPMAEPEARMEVAAVEMETHMEVVVADLKTPTGVTVEETMILTATTSDSMMATLLEEPRSSPTRSPRP